MNESEQGWVKEKPYRVWRLVECTFKHRPGSDNMLCEETILATFDEDALVHKSGAKIEGNE